jgi:phosphomannomutase
MKKGVIAASSDRVYHALEDMRRFFQGREVDLTDGVRVTRPGLWVHVRASATESVLRVIAEGEDEKEVEDLFKDTVARVNAVVHGKS